jgi:4-amino-4-deoxy-L-arabinose transferase-like glycosyltransferase
MRRFNPKVTLLCSAAFVLATAIAWGVFGALPHLEDEQANVFQAKVFASGHVTVDVPRVQPGAFFIPFIVQLNGRQFGKYPPGYPLALALGELIGQPWLINSIAAALGVLGAYLLGRDLFDEHTGLLAAALGVTSPMFVMLSGTLLAHSTTLAALVFFAWAFVRARRSAEPQRYRFAVLAGVSIGWATITRPFTAIVIGGPFVLIVLFDLIRSRRRLLSIYFCMAIAFAAIFSILPIFNLIATGSPTTNTYTLWWPQDMIGFGPQFGMATGGHTWQMALVDLNLDFPDFSQTLFGWPIVFGLPLAWLPIALGLIWPKFDKRDWGLVFLALLLVAAHMAYWARSGGGVYGPRYYSEGLPFLWIVAARGLLKFGATVWPRRLIKVALPVLILWGIVFATYPRMIDGFNLFNITRRDASLIATANIHHALVFVRSRYWTDYANLAWLNHPNLSDGDIIFAQDSGSMANQYLMQAYPDRTVYYYDRQQSIPLVAAR